MKRVIGLVFICGAASCVATTAATVPAVTKVPAANATPKPSASALAAAAAQKAAAKEKARRAAVALLAPADEYFGPLKHSIIGIRNTLRDLGLRYDVNHDIGTQTFLSAQLEERAIRDWEKRYPRDDQLPRAVYLLQRLYTKVLMRESRDRATVTTKWLQGDFARSPQAKQLSKTLAYEHLAPLPPPTPSPEPTAAPTAKPPPYESIFGPAYPSEFGTPAPASPGPIRRTALPAIPVHRTTPVPKNAPSPGRAPSPALTPSSAPTPSPSAAPTPSPAPSTRERIPGPSEFPPPPAPAQSSQPGAPAGSPGPTPSPSPKR